MKKKQFSKRRKIKSEIKNETKWWRNNSNCQNNSASYDQKEASKILLFSGGGQAKWWLFGHLLVWLFDCCNVQLATCNLQLGRAIAARC